MKKQASKIFLKVISIFLAFLFFAQSAPAITYKIFAAELGYVPNDLVATDNATAEEAEILYEDVSLRDERTKHFKMSDGTYMAVQYTSPVHYLNSENTWDNIDNSFTYDPKDNADSTDFDGYVNTSSDMEVKFAKDPSEGTLFEINDGENEISFSLENLKTDVEAEVIEKAVPTSAETVKEINAAAMSLDKYTGEISFEDAADKTDINYVLSSNSVKENIVINGRKNSYSYSFIMSLSGLVPALNEDGSISLMSSEDPTERKYLIPAPFMYDDGGRYSLDVEYSLSDLGSGKYKLTIEADKSFINSLETKFPVIVDPVIKMTGNDEQISDTYVSSTNTTTNYSGSPGIKIDGGSAVSRALVQFFQLPDLPASDVITSAELQYVNWGGPTGAILEAHNISTHQWSYDNVTWETQPAYDSEILDYAETGISISSAHSFDITRAVKEWLTDGKSNHGILLKLKDETSSNSIVVSSIKNTISNNSCFIVNYRSDKGIEDSLTYTTVDAGHGGTVYVNNENGSISLVRNDIASSSPVMPFSIYHVYNGYLLTNNYNSASAKTGTYNGMNVGKGWKLNIQQTVIPVSEEDGVDSSYKYVYADGDGTEHYFYLNDANELVDEDDLGLTLTVSETQYVIKDASDYTKTFKIVEEDSSSNGYLISEADSDGNTITYTYNTTYPSRIIHVSDPSGTEADLSYNNDDGYLSSITLNPETVNPTTVSYTYTNGRLTSVYDSALAATVASYNYIGSTGFHMTGVTDLTGKNVSIEFYNEYIGKTVAYNTKSISWKYAGAEAANGVNFEYAQGNSTTVKYFGHDITEGTADDIYTTYVFDYYGRCTLVYNEDYAREAVLGCGIYGYADGSNVTTIGSKDNNISKIASTGVISRNLIESSTGSWSIIDPSIGTFEETAEEAYEGETSFKYTLNSEEEVHGGIRKILGSTTGNITVSAYVKATEGVNGKIGMWVTSPSTGEILASCFDVIKTNEKLDNGWERISLTYDGDAIGAERLNIGIFGTSGTVYIDAIKAEKSYGPAPSAYDLLSGYGFESGSNLWTLSDAENITVTNTALDSDIKFGTSALKMTGSPSKELSAYRTVNVGGIPETSFILSGWGMAQAAKGEDGTSFKLFADVTYKAKDADGVEYTLTHKTDIPFSNETNAWQYTSAVVEMPENTDELTVTEITSIKVGASYDKNVNKALFDNISLTQSSALKINYDEGGNITSVITNNQPSYEYIYDENDNLKEIIDAEGVLVEKYEYVIDGNITTVKDKDGNITVYSNDRLTSQTTDGVTTNYTYSSIGEVSGTSVSATIDETLLTLSSSAVYNETRKTLTSQTDSRGKTTSYGYDTNLWLTLIEDAKGVQTRYEYNADGSIAKQYVDSDKDSSLDEGEGNVQYTYDTFGRINGVNANGMTYSFTYNNASLPEAVYISSVSDSNLLVHYTYDASYTNIISVQYGNGFTVGYTYDTLDNLTAVSYNGIEKFTYEYDGNGNVIKENVIKENDKANSITTKHLYDAAGSYLGSRTLSDAYTLEKYSDYDVETEVSSSIYNINGTDFTYASSFDEELDKNLYTLPTGAYSYTKDADAFGRDSGNVLKNSEGVDLISYDYSYTTDTEAGITTDYIVGWIATAGEDVNNFSYYYDDAGNISSIDLNGGLYVRYTYDERGQLLREDNVPKYRSYVWEYDDNGNILSKKTYYLSTGQLTATPLSTETYTYGNSVWKDQLTSSSATGSITYDSMGNPTKWRGMSNITWNGRELTSFVKYKKTATYSYNAEGIRTSYSFNGETVDYILDGTTILGEIRTDSDNVKSYIYYYYDENGEVIGLNYLGNDYYYIKNLQGDVMYITDDTGEIVVTYLYDAWGNILQIQDDSWDYVSEVNPFTYRSYYYDFETGLYYLQSRYYDPQTGRFLNADDTNYLGASRTTLGFNLYAYCENNPVNCCDPSGHYTYRFRLKFWMVSLPIDAILMWAAKAFCITWLGYMAPLSFLGDKAAEALFKKSILPKVLSIASSIVYYGAKLLCWIGEKALSLAFEPVAKGVLQLLVRQSSYFIKNCLSVGGLVAAILDYSTDKKFDENIKVY